MKRIKITPREGWQKQVEKLGFDFHTDEKPYWDESAYYELTTGEVELIEHATYEVWEMCLNAVQYVIDKKMYNRFNVPDFFIEQIEKSWSEDSLLTLYGRMDFVLKDGKAKLYEFNADTPTTILESSVVQKHWQMALFPDGKQSNNLQSALTNTWRLIKQFIDDNVLYFTCVRNSPENLATIVYLSHCARIAGIKVEIIFIDEIGWDRARGIFVDINSLQIDHIFKLFPYDFIVKTEFGKHIPEARNNTLWIEPAWKMLMSNKAIMAVLSKMYPESPYLLKTTFDHPDDMKSYAQKPTISRMGSNVKLVKDGEVIKQTEGKYGAPFIYQELCELPSFNGRHPVIGSWIIGQEPSGTGIRESDGLVSDENSRFVPHIVKD